MLPVTPTPIGAQDGTRTHYLRFTRAALFQLSLSGAEETVGFEPTGPRGPPAFKAGAIGQTLPRLHTPLRCCTPCQDRTGGLRLEGAACSQLHQRGENLSLRSRLVVGMPGFEPGPSGPPVRCLAAPHPEVSRWPGSNRHLILTMDALCHLNYIGVVRSSPRC